MRARLVCHLGVLGSCVWLVLTLPLGPAATAAALIAVATPLVVALPGLRAGSRYTQQWLAIAMVFYFGASLAETIAAQAQSRAAIGVLFFATLELWLLLRALKAVQPASHGSAEP